ncbi:MAG: YceI family protein [Bacteroidota bacterium]|nr:YceI family protein [Bacteroidota bacterium]
MKKRILTLSLALITVIGLSAFTLATTDAYKTKTGHVWFESNAEQEDITAHNYQVGSLLSAKDGKVAIKMAMTSFEFEKKTMQDHFNENYLESSKFPEASFAGKITNLKEVNFKKAGTYNATATGDLTIHGVTKNVTTNGTITVADAGVNLKAKFVINLKDYNVTIPSTVVKKVSDKISINADINYAK